MNEATQILRQEHEVILRVLDATEALAHSLEEATDVPSRLPSDVVDFLRQFADRRHHGKEEEFLFPALEESGMPRGGGPVAMMLMEHQFGRSHISRMAEAATAYAAGDRGAGAEWADAAQDYTALLREHIAKENNILFVMAERLLSPAEQQRLASQFEGVDTQTIGREECDRLFGMADAIVAEVNGLAKA